MPEVVGESIDRLCTIEMRFRPSPHGLPRDVTVKLYEAARQHAGAPLTYLAAQRLIDTIEAGDRVFVLCGSGSPPYLAYGETDGPLGGAAITRALELGLHAKPIVISESHIMGPNRATLAAAGLAVHDDEEVFAVRPHSVLPVEFPYGMDTRPQIEALFDQHDPAAVVFVERTGPNAEGIFHSVTGTPKRPDEVVANHIFAEVARSRGIFTLGIGDGGNEVGFGAIHAATSRIQPAGHAMTVTETDVLVAAAISNWGAYGVAAMLGFLLEDPNLIQDTEMEYRMLQACTAAGAADGAYTSPVMAVDGTSWRTQQALVTMLRETVTLGLTELDRAF